MKRFHSHQEGFTLIELMIVVVIIGILAAIAIPNFLKFQLKSKSAESANIGAIQEAGEAFQAKWSNYVQTSKAFPATCGSPTKVAWTHTLAGAGGFFTLGYKPTGAVTFCYCIGTGAPAASGAPGAAQVNTCNGTADTTIGAAAGRPVIVSGVAAAAGTVDIYNFAAADLDNDGASQGYLNTDENRELIPDPLDSGEEEF